MNRRKFDQLIATACMALIAKPESIIAKCLHNSDDDFLLGGDISMLQRIEKAGGVFNLNKNPKDLIEIFKNHGCNCFRLRLFVNPNYENAEVNDLNYTLQMASRIKKAGKRLLLDLHYSDTFAGPGKQYKPSAWSNLDFNSLLKKVESYSAEVIKKFNRENLLPDIVQIGNEISSGILWPDGSIKGDDRQNPKQWQKFTQLLKAGIGGIRNALNSADHVRIMLHSATGGDVNETQVFFNKIKEYSVNYDIIGLSYYPWHHGSLEDLERNLKQTVRLFQKDIVIVETAYPWRYYDDWKMKKEKKKKHMIWPMTPKGQKQFLSELITTVLSIPEGRGKGVIWWYPESIPVNNLRVWRNGAMALFDQDGNMLPAVKAFSKVK